MPEQNQDPTTDPADLNATTILEGEGSSSPEDLTTGDGNETPPDGEAPPSEPSELELYQQALRESSNDHKKTQQQLLQLQQELAALRADANKPPPEVEEELPDFMSPKEQMMFLKKEIAKAVAESTKGVNEVARNYGRQSQIAEAKSLIAAHAEFGPMVAEMGSEADSIIDNYPDFNNPQGLALLLQAKYGQMARAGQLKKPDITTTTTAPPTVRNPTLPNKPPASKPTSKAPALVITEAERVMASRRGMSPEEWCEVRDLGETADINQLNAIHAKYHKKGK